MAALWFTVIGGLAGFAVAHGKHDLFDVGSAGILGAVAAAALYLSALVVHELAHAFAVKSRGRQVRRAGFMLMFGLPFAPTSLGSSRRTAGQARLWYRWRRSNGEVSGQLREEVEGGQHTVRLHLRWTFQGAGTYHARARLEVLEPTPATASGGFTYRCSS